MFISFEGIDGVGKTTQISLLSNFLTEQSIDHIVTQEPDAGNIGQKIREITCYEDKIDIDTELLLFIAARNEHYKTLILPALQQNKIVLCDRFIHSTIAYQTINFSDNISKDRIDFILNLHNSLHINSPDLTFLLYSDNIHSIQNRVLKRKEMSKYDKKDLDYHTKLQNIFKRNIDILGNNTCSIEVSKTEREILKEIICNSSVNLTSSM